MYYLIFFILLAIGAFVGGAYLGAIGVLLGAVSAFILTLGLAALLAYLGVG